MLRIRTAGTGSAAGVPYLSTMYFTGSTQTEADSAAAAVRAFWLAIQVRMLTGIQMQVESQVLVIDPGTGQPTNAFTTSTASVAGTGSGSALPTSNQGLVRWSTGVFIGGRQVRGRTFLPYVPVSENSGGRPIAGYVTAVAAAAATLVSVTSPEMVVWSRTHGVQPGVTGGSVWSEFAVLRSRRQ